MDLTGWDYILTFGYDLDLYGKGKERIAVCRATGRVVVKYLM